MVAKVAASSRDVLEWRPHKSATKNPRRGYPAGLIYGLQAITWDHRQRRSRCTWIQLSLVRLFHLPLPSSPWLLGFELWLDLCCRLRFNRLWPNGPWCCIRGEQHPRRRKFQDDGCDERQGTAARFCRPSCHVLQPARLRVTRTRRCVC